MQSRPPATLQAVSRLLIVGGGDGTQVGASLLRAAQSMGIEARLLDTAEAAGGSLLRRQIAWRLLGHRPSKLHAFGRRTVEAVRRFSPQAVLTTGHAPLNAKSLSAIAALGVITINYSTDDPWNPDLTGRWFLRALARYHYVFTPRLANLGELQHHCSGSVAFLPFGYEPTLFYADAAEPAADTPRHEVLFVGGADAERARYLGALMQAGIEVGLYGSYWERHVQTRRLCRGRATPEQLRRLTGAAAVCVVMPRFGNRDGHVMRSLEVPAMAAAMIAYDSPEHRQLFGDDGACVRYFSSPEALVKICRTLLMDKAARQSMALRGHQHILGSHHTYADRLATMLRGAFSASGQQ